MKLNTADILKLVPEFMRDDSAVKGLAAAVNDLIRTPGARVKTARVWDQIDELDDAQLDELAYELDIDWYSSALPLENKRAVVKISDLVHTRRGTRWAVEQLISAYISPGSVVEWYEDGYINPQPFHFSITTSNRHVTDDILQEFKAIARVAMSVRSRLDAIYFSDKYGSTVIAFYGKPAAYMFTPKKCGTIPRQSTIGDISRNGAEAAQLIGSAPFELAEAGDEKAGTLPKPGTVGAAYINAAAAAGASGSGNFSCIKCGTAKCG